MFATFEADLPFEANLPTLRDVLLAALAAIPGDRSCACADAPGGLGPDLPA